mgnify:CR=1 FL=1
MNLEGKKTEARARKIELTKLKLAMRLAGVPERLVDSYAMSVFFIWDGKLFNHAVFADNFTINGVIQNNRMLNRHIKEIWHIKEKLIKILNS